MENLQKPSVQEFSPFKSGAAKAMWAVMGVAACVSVALGVFLYFSPAERGTKDYLRFQETGAASQIEDELNTLEFDDLGAELPLIEKELE